MLCGKACFRVHVICLSRNYLIICLTKDSLISTSSCINNVMCVQPYFSGKESEWRRGWVYPQKYQNILAGSIAEVSNTN